MVGMERKGYQAAIVRAREYFEQFRPIYRVDFFEVEGVRFDEDEEAWTVLCSFIPGYATDGDTPPVTPRRVYHEVKVSQDGTILKVGRLKNRSAFQ